METTAQRTATQRAHGRTTMQRAHECTTMQRARGRAEVVLRDGALRDLAQSGCAKAMLPRTMGPAEAVFLNTSGGLTGGDRIEQRLAVEGGRAIGTTQTAERLYASAGGAASVETRLTVGPGARLDWLPQETIVFDRGALRRRTVAELAPGAVLLMAEMLVLGRGAMAETVRTLDLTDRREVRRGGRPVWIEPLRITGAVLARGTRTLLGAARAIATLVLVAPGAEDAAARLRERHEGVEAAASGWNGRAVLRMRAADPAPLRRALARAIGSVGGHLPLVWPREPSGRAA